MFDIGFFELTLIAIVALLVLGPERLPHAARMSGAFLAKIRRTIADLKVEISKEVEIQEMQERAHKLANQEPLQAVQEAIQEAIQKPAVEIETLKSQVTQEIGTLNNEAAKTEQQALQADDQPPQDRP